MNTRDGHSRVRLARFTKTVVRGRSKPTEALWYLTKLVFFTNGFRWPSALKRRLLRLFGADIGTGVLIAPRVNIHMPWKLSIGDDVWIGEDVMLLDLERIEIGSNSCISQRAFLCTGNHDYKRETFDYNGLPIRLGDGTWIGASSFVGPGVSTGIDTVVSAGSVVVDDLPAGHICAGNPCVPVRPRVFDADDD